MTSSSLDGNSTTISVWVIVETAEPGPTDDLGAGVTGLSTPRYGGACRGRYIRGRNRALGWWQSRGIAALLQVLRDF